MNKFIMSIVAAILLLSSCGQGHEHQGHDHDHHGHGPGHAHEEVVLHLAGYCDSLEVFAEATPFAVGQPSTIIAHVTSLADFKPLSGATVTISLVVGRDGIRQTVTAPQREGIFRFSLEPVAAGTGQLVFDVSWPRGGSRVVIPGVTVHPDAHQAIHAAGHQPPDEPNAILFTKEQSWGVDFATGYPTLAPFGQVIRAAAQVQPAQGDEVLLTARAAGTVVFGQRVLASGVIVEQGAQLLVVSTTGLAQDNMAIRLREAGVNFETARLNLERAEALAAERIVPERELIQARADFEKARVEHENLSRNFTTEGHRVVSPASGSIARVWVSNGQHVEVGQPLVTVARNHRLQLLAHLGQAQAGNLGELVSATIRSPQSNRVFSLEELQGRLVSVGQSVNPVNHMVPVLLEVDQPGHLFPGALVELNLVVSNGHQSLVIPNTGVMETQGHYYVFVQLTPELFARREVTIGRSDGVLTEIVNGVSPRDRVVTRGAVWVKLAQASTALDPHAGHVH